LAEERTITQVVLFFLERLSPDSAEDSKLTPTQIILSKPDELTLRWIDGSESKIPVKALRDNCPCASCQGETVLLRTYKPSEQPEKPGKYLLKGAQQVGYYALQVFWGDGHQTGIYTWDKLLSLSSTRPE